MKRINGIWLPDSDTHFEYMMGKEPPQEYLGRQIGTYQFFKIKAALSMVTEWKCALDVGAHVGFWSMWLAQRFQYVHAFEPMAEHADCFACNVTGHHVTLHRIAVGDVSGSIGMESHQDNSGKAKISGYGDIPVEPIDSYGIDGVGLLKIDTEGYEVKVIRGAAETIARCRPVIVVEVNKNATRYGDETPDDVLPGMGYSIAMELGHDRIYRYAP